MKGPVGALVLLLLAIQLASNACAPSPILDHAPDEEAASASGSAIAIGQSKDGLDALLDSPEATGALWGISVRSLATGRTLFQKNGGKLFVPASNMKLFTTAVALVRLGPDFTYVTNLYAGGPVEKGILAGDLVVRGSGDPTISERFHGRAEAIFEKWADQLVQQGIREIRGDLVGDAGLFDDGDLGRGWAWDDELACHSARVSALSFNDNCVEVSLSPGSRTGQAPRIAVNPETAYLTIRNQVATSAGKGTEIVARRRFGSATITLSGRMGEADPPWRIRLAVGNPTLYAVTVLKEVFERKGIKVEGRAIARGSDEAAPAYDSMRPLFSHRSAPLARIIEETNKQSRNLYAELLFRTLGAAAHGGRGTTERAIEAMKESLAAMGIPPDSLGIYDGSGLSRLNLVSPEQVVDLLDYMSTHPYFGYFYRSLPVAGVDGTLVRRMRDTGAEGKIRAKTGTLAHTVSLSGYLPDRHGRLVAFSIMTNNCLAPPAAIRSLEDAMCERLIDTGAR